MDRILCGTFLFSYQQCEGLTDHTKDLAAAAHSVWAALEVMMLFS